MGQLRPASDFFQAKAQVEKEQLEQIESRTRDLESEQNKRTVIDNGGGLGSGWQGWS
jgi:hypothetical protein